MDAVWSLSGDRLDGSAEGFYLPPQRHQAGPVGVLIDHGHLRAWMHLGRRAQERGGDQDYIHSLTADKVINQPWRMEAGLEGGSFFLVFFVCLFFSRKSLQELKRGLKT